MVNMRKWLGGSIAALSTIPGLTLRLGLYHVSPAAVRPLVRDGTVIAL